MVFDQNIKSFFKLIRKWKNNKKSLSGCPHLPNYKHKIKGRNIIIFTSQQSRVKDGFIHLPKKVDLAPIKTKVKEKIKQVRIVPKSSCYVIEVVYERQEKEHIQNDRYLSIDLGVNNLTTCFDSKNQSSFIINGRPLKSMNQYFNKKKGNIQSDLEKNHKKKTSKRLSKLTMKRNNKIKDYLHKSSGTIVDYCIKNNISNVVIGLNKEWKQGSNIGKKNNQNFVQIPFDKLIKMITYKGQLEGIKVVTHEESYTSKCSSLDLEMLCHHDTYLGKRMKRGIFLSKDWIKINADLNGAINILRKETGDKLINLETLTSRGQAVWPVKVNLN
jgi:putative transposase